MTTLIALLVFVVLSAAIFLVGSLIEQNRAYGNLLRERLTAVQEAETRRPDEQLALLRDELLSEVPSIHRLLLRIPRISDLQNLISQADLELRAGRLLLVCGMSGLVCGWITLLWVRSFVLALALAGLAAALPILYVAVQRRRRFLRFETLFPEAIDLLARAVRAGHSFTTALEIIATEVSAPVGPEFRNLFEEQKFGLPLRDALSNLLHRLPLLDVKFFATAVVLQRETGGNLAEILDNLSYVIRQRFKIQRQVRVYTAQGRLTLAILMALPPVLMVVMSVLNPGFLQPMFVDPLGHFMIVTGALLQVIGYFLIRRIIHIKV